MLKLMRIDVGMTNFKASNDSCLNNLYNFLYLCFILNLFFSSFEKIIGPRIVFKDISEFIHPAM